MVFGWKIPYNDYDAGASGRDIDFATARAEAELLQAIVHPHIVRGDAMAEA
jgi:hypothetical protein